MPKISVAKYLVKYGNEVALKIYSIISKKKNIKQKILSKYTKVCKNKDEPETSKSILNYYKILLLCSKL